MTTIIYTGDFINPNNINPEDINITLEEKVYELKYYSDSIKPQALPYYCNVIWESHHCKYIDDKFMCVHHIKYIIKK